jgi:hypothetical protein
MYFFLRRECFRRYDQQVIIAVAILIIPGM